FSPVSQISYALQHFPYASPNSPQSKYYVQLMLGYSSLESYLDLGLTYYPEFTTIKLHQTTQFYISLSNPSHRINGNGTVRVQWNTTECMDCFTLSPKEFHFNINNFQEKQILTTTRIKNAPKTFLIPIIYGEGYELIPPGRFLIYID
ncbi:unnamed protein product, partial [Adineta steineri]